MQLPPAMGEPPAILPVRLASSPEEPDVVLAQEMSPVREMQLAAPMGEPENTPPASSSSDGLPVAPFSQFTLPNRETQLSSSTSSRGPLPSSVPLLQFTSEKIAM